LIHQALPEGLSYTFVMCIASVVIVVAFSYGLGLTNSERAFVNEKIKVVSGKIIRNDKRN
jgi:hypothetical protein